MIIEVQDIPTFVSDVSSRPSKAVKVSRELVTSMLNLDLPVYGVGDLGFRSLSSSFRMGEVMLHVSDDLKGMRACLG